MKPSTLEPVSELVADVLGPVAVGLPERVPTLRPLDLSAGVELPGAPPGVRVRYVLVLAEIYGKVSSGSLQLRSSICPEYPEAARALGVGGTVVVEARIDGKGEPGGVQVRRSAHSLLDGVARDAVAKWRTSGFVNPDPRTYLTGYLSVAVTFTPPSAR